MLKFEKHWSGFEPHWMQIISAAYPHLLSALAVTFDPWERSPPQSFSLSPPFPALHINNLPADLEMENLGTRK